MSKVEPDDDSVFCPFRVNLCESARDYWRLELEIYGPSHQARHVIEKHLLKGSTSGCG